MHATTDLAGLFQHDSHSSTLPVCASTSLVQGRDDIRIYKALFLHLFTLQFKLVWKRCRDEVLYFYLHYYIIPTLFAYFAASHPYIFIFLV